MTKHKLARINLENHGYQIVTYYTEQQFHDYLRALIGWQNTILAKDRNWFCRWYQKAFNQSRTSPVWTTDVWGNKVIDCEPESFAYVDLGGYLTFLSADQAYYLYIHYQPDKQKRSFPALPRHNRYSYRGTIAGRGGERYYAKMADLRYHKSLGEPKPRGGHQKNASKNHWEDWELETRSDCANWKAHKKYHHQYEQKIFREEKRIKKSSRH